MFFTITELIGDVDQLTEDRQVIDRLRVQSLNRAFRRWSLGRHLTLISHWGQTVYQADYSPARPVRLKQSRRGFMATQQSSNYPKNAFQTSERVTGKHQMVYLLPSLIESLKV